MPKVGIIISNYNGWQDTLVCLESLQRQTFTDFEIILIDDASPNDSVAQLQDKLPPNTVFLPQQQNVGFAAANNIGIRRALADGCDFALLLNNDTAARPDFLEKLLAETPAGAVSCPKMLFMDPPDDPKTGRVKHLGGHEKDGPRFAEKKQVSFITFCCVLLPRAVISPHIHLIDLRRTVGINISGSPYATSPASSFAISPRSGSINSSNSSLFSISRSDTNGTVEKQYTPRSKSLYARSVMWSRSAISACVKPRFSRREHAYSDRYRLITDLYSSTSKDLRFRQILCHKQHNKLLEGILP